MSEQPSSDEFKVFVLGALAEAEIRGFRRAAEFAAKLARARAEEISAKLLPVSAVNELHGWADVILATLEQTSDSNRPHPLSGAGNVEKI